jgi:hypothetical protein
MQIVIKLSKKDLDDIKYNDYIEDTYYTMLDAITNGIQLPKSHGRLIDANRLRSMYSINRANFNTVVGIQKWIDDAPTIIEADEVEE